MTAYRDEPPCCPWCLRLVEPSERVELAPGRAPVHARCRAPLIDAVSREPVARAVAGERQRFRISQLVRDFGAWLEVHAAVVCVSTMVLVTLGGLICLTYLSLRAPGTAEYCYLEREYNGGRTLLKESIDWHPDRTIAEFTDFDAAVAAAKKISCELR